MKKVLLTTSILAFAGSAFAADVSGYVISAYKNVKGGTSGNGKNQFTETEVYLSGSKTASNGLTFGANYTILFKGNSAKTTAATNEVNSFVSSSFGKLTMGAHPSASKSHGVSALSVGNGIDGSITAVAGRVDTEKGLTYETPVFNGLSAAYTMEFGSSSVRYYAFHYSAKYAGVSVRAAYGSSKPNSYRDNSLGIQVSKGPFAVSYGRGKDKGTSTKNQTRWGASYDAGKVSLGYSRLSSDASGTKTVSSVISVSYAVASGLDVFMEQQKSGNVKTQLIGTNISF